VRCGMSMHRLQLRIPRLGFFQNGDVMGVIGSGQQESAGETHNPANEIAAWIVLHFGSVRVSWRDLAISRF
jgi:hypothetical protein